MIEWMLYACGVSALVATAGHLVESPMAHLGLPRRLVWLGVMSLTCLVPLMGAPEVAPLPELTLVAASSASSELPLEASSTLPWDYVALWGWILLSTLWTLAAGGTLLVLAVARRRWDHDKVWARRVLVSQGFGPALVGVRRPDIVLPRWVLGMAPEDLRIVVEHEDEHRKARDHLILLAGATLTGLMAWNPVAWWSLRQLRRSVEIDCDERVLRSGTPVTRYGKVLLDVSEGRSGSWGFAPGMVHPTSTLERRLKTMGRRRRRGGVRVWASLALGLIMVFAACETPAPTAVRNAMDDALATRAAAQEVERKAPPPVNIILESATGSTPGQPIVFVDGERLDDELGEIEVEDIARVEVLKGEAARRLYGEQGRAGVIQIYLKGYDAPPPPPAPETLRPRREVVPTAPGVPSAEWAERARLQEQEARVRIELAAAERIADTQRVRVEAERSARRTQELRILSETRARAQAEERVGADREREVRRVLEEVETARESLQSTHQERTREWERERRRLREALLSIDAELKALERDLEGPRLERLEEVQRQLQAQLEELRSKLRTPQPR